MFFFSAPCTSAGGEVMREATTFAEVRPMSDIYVEGSGKDILKMSKNGSVGPLYLWSHLSLQFRSLSSWRPRGPPPSPPPPTSEQRTASCDGLSFYSSTRGRMGALLSAIISNGNECISRLTSRKRETPQLHGMSVL